MIFFVCPARKIALKTASTQRVSDYFLHGCNGIALTSHKKRDVLKCVASVRSAAFLSEGKIEYGELSHYQSNQIAGGTEKNSMEFFSSQPS